VVLSPGVVAAIVTGFFSLASACLCFKLATAASKPRSPQYKWLAIGFLLPVISVLILLCLRKRGHFDASAPSYSSQTSFPNAPYGSAPNGYAQSVPYIAAPNDVSSTQQYVSPNDASDTQQYVSPIQDHAPAAGYFSAPYGQAGYDHQSNQMLLAQQGYSYSHDPPPAYPYYNTANI
jgi:hypothetical protein